MNNITKALPAITLCLVSHTFAAGAPVTHQFQGGQPASASQVNENFQELANRIDALPAATVTASYDYRQFLSTVSTKTFRVRGNSCDTETLSYTRTPNGANTRIAISRTTTNSGSPCSDDIQYYTATPTQYEHTASGVIDINTQQERVHTRYVPAELIALNPMQPGRLYNSYSEILYTPFDSPEESNGFSLRDISAVGIEDVTVPAGTFTGCLKIRRNHYSGTSASHSLVWRCPVVGEIKYLFITSTGGYTYKELTAYTP